ncbi:MAG: hypothetical protein QXW41_07685 [Fervidicoccaceae archaeon]
MGAVLILPIGITGETVQGILNAVKDHMIGIITVSTPGFEETKKEIIQGVRQACELIGAEHHHIVVGPGEVEPVAELYRLLKRLRPSRVIISGVTGSRYLFPLIAQVALRYWHETRAEVLLIHGVEGERWSLVPLTGFFTYDLKREQREVFMRIYSDPRDVLSTKELINKYSYSRSVYKVLKKLEEKGLIRHRRNRIEKILSGYLLYLLLKEGERFGA